MDNRINHKTAMLLYTKANILSIFFHSISHMRSKRRKYTKIISIFATIPQETAKKKRA